MQRWITRPVKFNAVICGLIGAAFGLPPGKIGMYLIGGLIFGMAAGLLTEALLRRFDGRWPYKRRLFILIGLESLLLLYVWLPIYLAYFTVHPFFRQDITAMPDDMDVEVVSLTTPDGVALHGWYIPSQNGAAIIALHGGGGSRLSVLPYARLLTEHGYGVLLLDMRAHGESGGVFATGWDAELDFAAALTYLHSRSDVDADRIGALGLSSGAVTILYGGAPYDSVRAFVADGVAQGTVQDLLNPLIPHPIVAPLLIPDYWTAEYFIARFSGVQKGPPLREVVRDIAPRPILFIAAEDSLWELELAEKYAASAGESAQVWLVPDTGHIGAIDTHTEEYVNRVVGFFDAALLDN